MADFEKNHPGIVEQELWKLFVNKANEQGLNRDFISAVGEVCAIGLNLSKYIIRFFPTFTLHDETHSANVCRWMWVLLGEKRAQLTAHEAALLLMAACCHDIGMAVSPEQEEQMRLRTYPGWDNYFRQNVQGYLDWVAQELKHCAEELVQTGSDWRSLRLPYRINTDGVARNGYAAGKFCMTMDQDKVIDLLTGENLYSDAGVFVRELLQNSIDAVLMRAKQDPNFSLEDGLIQIDTWMDEEANTWFRIRDNGTGMNEHIIQNHFLKVGNSYYTSEEFQYANRHAPKGSYNAISRFGIGILSCFMGDKEHTQLKVSTKRFDEGTQCGIRLDVTGLHGYYFLCNEKEHLEGENWFPEMPSQNKEDRGYRTEPGTTICVNTNLLKMGELRSFREILDKYVQFPGVRVTYNSPEGNKEYPTQQELMKVVYALNLGGEIREYVYEIPDEDFEEVMRSFPYHIFEEKPRVILSYEPLDWLSDSEKLTGVRISAEAVEPKARIREVEDQRLREVLEGRRIEASVVSIDGVGVRIRYRLNDSSDIPRGIAPKDGVFVTLLKENQSIRLSREEKRLWELCIGALCDSEAGRTLIAYNGVLAQSDQDTILHDFDSCRVILLREDFLPQVNMARNQIKGIPLEAVCCMSMAGLSDAVPDKSWWIATVRELWEILDRHQGWTEVMQAEKSIFSWLFSPRGVLWMAHWKRQYQVSFRYTELHPEWYVDTKKTADERTADLPAAMFSTLDWDVLCRSCLFFTVYSPSHRFSQWLIEHREKLVKQVPNLYDAIINTMMLSRDEMKIREVLNTSLDLLRKADGNPFRVPADLILTESDFY